MALFCGECVRLLRHCVGIVLNCKQRRAVHAAHYFSVRYNGKPAARQTNLRALSSVPPRSRNCFAGGTLVHTSNGTQTIETIRVGQRVITYLPHERPDETFEEPTAFEWLGYRLVTLLLPCQNDEWIRLQLLRPEAWLIELEAEVGETVWIDMLEMGAKGEAIVEAIDLCPVIESGPGRIVTGAFEHSTGTCLQLFVAGEARPIQVTSGHPLWDPTLKIWRPSGNFRLGDLVANAYGQDQIMSVTSNDKKEPVYNIEVEGDHCYRVGEQGLLVHNASVVYRGMIEATNGGPEPSPTARKLGVRPGGDVPAVNDDDDDVDPDDGGMSVAPDDPMNLQPHRRPPSLGRTGKDPVWSIDTSNLGPKLKYRRDNSKHGTVLPAKKMTLAEFQQALAETASKWTKVC